MDSEDSPTPPPPPSHEPSVPPPPPKDPAKREADWAMGTHLSGLACMVGIPGFVGPLVLWLVKKDEMPRVNTAGKEAINFHLTMLIVQLISIPLVFIFIGFITLFGAVIVEIVFSVLAAVEASRGKEYIYPLTWRMIK